MTNNEQNADLCFQIEIRITDTTDSKNGSDQVRVWEAVMDGKTIWRLHEPSSPDLDDARFRAVPLDHFHRGLEIMLRDALSLFWSESRSIPDLMFTESEDTMSERLAEDLKEMTRKAKERFYTTRKIYIRQRHQALKEICQAFKVAYKEQVTDFFSKPGHRKPSHETWLSEWIDDGEEKTGWPKEILQLFADKEPAQIAWQMLAIETGMAANTLEDIGKPGRDGTGRRDFFGQKNPVARE